MHDSEMRISTDDLSGGAPGAVFPLFHAQKLTRVVAEKLLNLPLIET